MTDTTNPTIHLSLPLAVVNYTLKTLAMRPYEEVQAVIEQIQSQAQKSLAASTPIPAPAASVEPASVAP